MRKYARRTVAERFWEKVVIGAAGDCWEWKGARCREGLYGRFSFRTSRPSSTRNAHTVAWELARKKALPEGKVVRHRCDNPACCNPKHLLLGTQKQNIADMMRRGRRGERTPKRGEEHGRARLKANDVIAMREAHAKGATVVSLARAYGVHEMTASCAIHRRTWRHL